MNTEEYEEKLALIREEYIQSGLSLRKLAQKHGVSQRTLERRSAREAWPALRQQPSAGCAAKKLEETVVRLLRLLQQDFEDPQQFHRYLVKIKGTEEPEERIFQKLDTKALKEVTSALKELKALLRDGEEPEEKELRVVFDAGEEDWNE